MSDLAIECHRLSKRYRLGEREPYRALRDVLTQAVHSGVRRARGLFNGSGNGAAPVPVDTLWALRDVSFGLNHGEALGIIGRNGAGKSTLLKILARITRPTSGEAWMHGRVGSLLEVGTGFHPELTGRENIFLNGVILGMRRSEIKRKFDEIVSFAEIERFVDTPVKRYSSGMYVRLAFAVAAHLETEILIVDEVLAVGDAAFQKKCLGKMTDVCRGGRTICFVSHNMAAIQSLCRHAIWLDGGRLVLEGAPASVTTAYLQSFASACTTKEWPDRSSAPGNESVRLHGASVKSLAGAVPETIVRTMPFTIEITYWNLKPDARLNLSLALLDQSGTCVFVTTTLNEAAWDGQVFPVGLFRSVCYVPGELLNDGAYSVVLRVVQDQAIVLYAHEDLLTFEVHDSPDDRGAWFGDWMGVVRPALRWATTRVDGPDADRAIPRSRMSAIGS